MNTPMLPGLETIVHDIEAPLDRVSVPYAKDSETSKAGAKKVESIAGAQCQWLLSLYRMHGPLTDAEAADWMSRIYNRRVERTTVIPRRKTLMKAGKVEQKGVRKNERTGVNNVIWGLR